jgi:hypothetical protein
VTAVGAVFSPLDKQLKLLAKNWSEGVAKQAVWLSGIVDYRQAQEILEKVGQISISTSSVWRQTQDWGERFQALEQQERLRASVLPVRWIPTFGKVEETGRMGVAMDGGMMHIRGEGWKEFKLGSVCDVRVWPTRDEETGEMIELAHAVNNSYIAHLGGPDVFGEMIWAEAARRDWEYAADTEVIGDGAPWIWNLALDHFYDSRQMVDWYHATEHLAAAARLIEGEGTPAAKRWFKAQAKSLFQGHILQVVSALEAEAQQNPAIAEGLLKEAGYFYNNQRRMNYQEMREEGWLIGSGAVESAAKQYKARFAGAGMRWSRSGAERLLPIRSAIMSGRFDECWQQTYNSPLN